MGFLNLDDDRDHYRLVYVTFFWLGMTMLFSFNSFVSAPDFMMKYYKYCSHEDATTSMSNVWDNIESYISVASMVPNLIFQVALISNFGRRFKMHSRLLVAMGMIAIGLALVPLMTYGRSSEHAALGVLMLAVILCSTATAIFQATVFALAASFPPIITGAVLFGVGASGTISCLAQIITKASLSESFFHTQLQARIYFGFAIGVVVISMATLLLLQYNPYAIRFVSEYRESEDRDNIMLRTLLSPSTRAKITDLRSPLSVQGSAKFEDIPDPSVLGVLRSIKGMLFSCFFTFFITLTLFPGIGVAVDPNNAWFGIIIVAMFNFGDTAGRLGSNFQRLWIPRRALPLIAILRVGFMPLFFLSISPKLIHGNGWALFFMLMVGITNGLPGSLAMIYAPMTTALETEKERHVAGNAMSISLLAGCSVGSLLALLLTSQEWL